MMRWLWLAICLIWPCAGLAQGAATLVADRVTLNDEGQLVATGNIEVLYLGDRMRAQQIIYDQTTDRLQIVGPIVIQTADGTVLTADQGTLDPRLENGILQGARIVLDQQLQLVANQIDQRQGRYSQLYKSAATSCQVCGNRPPLWEIRAERVVHDQQEQLLYFTNATFRIRGVPILWLPRMRLPDPSLDRATGFLEPEQRSTTQLGTGIKIPYFVTLGDHADITITPYISPETRTLELIYRQAFVGGRIRADAAVSDDTLREDNRSYIFAEGAFDLPNDVQLRFDIEAVSDRAYLQNYGYSGKDRLDSAVSLLRVTDATLAQTRLTYYQTLRDDEANDSLPPLIADARYQSRSRPAFGGTLTFDASLDAAYRFSNTDGEDGRDVVRGGLRGEWQESWVLPEGLVANVQTDLRGDIYRVADDAAFPDTDVRVVPGVAGVLRWPLGRSGPTGIQHLVEPAISASWSEAFGGEPPNEDSTRSELDTGNLFDLSRFSGDDAVETGSQLAAGLNWSRIGRIGTTSTLSFGRVWRNEGDSEFTQSSGLEEVQSDWLVGGQLTIPGGFLLDARGLIDDNSGLNRADARMTWRNRTIALDASYIWQSADIGEDRPDTISEWTFDADFDLSAAWSLGVDARYDIAADRPVRSGIGLEWRNECVRINVSASRRFTSSDTVEPTTDYRLSGAIIGFSTGRAGGAPAGACRN
ncbi:LPS-assembly protein LptD [Cognatiyoonia sp. IB215182]|uniref:LPS-assembly protein LptD n=1 Tax=Cognatiyoonia sp. IB215182 TaxID=3097353 RepID=UPI002A0DB544|nr:LPS assembly protein LptD [Cognatiyoonia sp. IB215182]MDX8352107.1 LPS assembly protein LptD [Cognatiyoonia sp. IB215182]